MAFTTATSPSPAASCPATPTATQYRTVPVAVDSPPLPPVVDTERHYVPYETDNYRRAHGWAAEQIARKFPGAGDLLTTMDSLIKQFLAGNK